jgi:hypothetical protein
MQTSRKIPVSVWGMLCIFLLLISIPYLYAWSLGGDDRVFGGFLLNPIDGNSYYAKMMLGWSGQWEFHLLYTAQDSAGTPLFIFYILLGHIAHWIEMSIPLTFHLARLVGAVCLFFSIYHLAKILFPQSEPWVNRLTFLLAFGSGMGWVLLTSGIITSDFWVAEAYPFLSAYSNPHFCLGLAILIELLIRYRETQKGKAIFIVGILALLESLIMPFGIILCGAIGGLLSLFDIIRKKAIAWEWLISVGVGGGVYVLYQYYITNQEPLLVDWNAQNITGSPSPLDFLLSFCPVFVLAIIQVFRKKTTVEPIQEVLTAWIMAATLLVIIPFNLQRRFMFGFYIPCAALAILFIRDVISSRSKKLKWLFPALLVFSLPTNLLIIAAGMNPQNVSDPVIYPQTDLIDGLHWLQENGTNGEIVLASAEVGLFVPAYTGLHVVYGHPFETIHADETAEIVTDLYAGYLSDDEVAAALENWGIEWILIDQYPLDLELQISDIGWQPVFRQGSVAIYSLP